MWHLFGQLLADALMLMSGNVVGGSVDAAVNVLNSPLGPAVMVPADALTLFGFFINWGVLFGSIAAVMTWRGIFIAYRVYRLVVGFIPLPG